MTSTREIHFADGYVAGVEAALKVMEGVYDFDESWSAASAGKEMILRVRALVTPNDTQKDG